MAELLNPNKGTWVFLCFFAFFAMIVVVNVVFIKTALSTHSGVVTEHAYEKGLAYNEKLKAARSQPELQTKAVFEDSVLRWHLKDENGQSLNADVSARLVRPVKDGQDFDVIMTQASRGVYEADLNLPMKGRWEAQLSAKWQTQHYQTRFSFIAK